MGDSLAQRALVIAASTPRILAGETAELGVVVRGATGRDITQPVAVLGGVWTAYGLTVSMAREAT